MKIFSLFVLGLLCTTSVFAADGNVPASTLSSLGLGGMQRVSDVEGLKVRGQATATLSTNGTSLIFGQLVDPVTNSAVVVQLSQLHGRHRLGGHTNRDLQDSRRDRVQHVERSH